MDVSAVAVQPSDAPRKVFISYARQDRRFALRLTRGLRAKGVTVWIDTEIQGGDDWLTKLNEGLQASDEVFLILSPRSKASQWVKREVLAAFNRGKHVTPVLYRKCGGWDLIGDVEPIDFTEWYDEGFAKLLHDKPKPRTFWRSSLILLNKISRPLLAVLALGIGIAAVAYFRTPSNTTFSVLSGDKSGIVVRVRNQGGRPSILMGSSFRLSFGSLPIETEPLVLVHPETHSRIAGHSDDQIILLGTVKLLTPKMKDEESYFSWCDIEPLLPSAKLTLTAQVKESDDRLHTRSDEFLAERIKTFVKEAFPDDVPGQRCP